MYDSLNCKISMTFKIKSIFNLSVFKNSTLFDTLDINSYESIISTWHYSCIAVLYLLSLISNIQSTICITEWLLFCTAICTNSEDGTDQGNILMKIFYQYQ